MYTLKIYNLKINGCIIYYYILLLQCIFHHVFNIMCLLPCRIFCM